MELHLGVHKSSSRYSGYDAHDCVQLACVLYIHCSYQAQSLCLSIFLFRYLFDLILLEKHKRLLQTSQTEAASCYELHSIRHAYRWNIYWCQCQSDKHVWSWAILQRVFSWPCTPRCHSLGVSMNKHVWVVNQPAVCFRAVLWLTITRSEVNQWNCVTDRLTSWS